MPPAVAVSTVAFALRPPLGSAIGSAAPRPGEEAGAPTLWIPLVRRTRAPFLGRWALPGGPTRWNETLADTALRTLHDAVLRAPGYLEQLYSFGGVERSADAQRLVTIAYWALYGERDLAAEPSLAVRVSVPDAGRAGEPAPIGAPAAAGVRAVDPADGSVAPARWDDVPVAGDPSPALDTAEGPSQPGEEGACLPDLSDPNVSWFSADALPELAFDHAEIVAYALERLRVKTEYSAIAHLFLGPVFTLGQLRTVHEAVRGESVDPANFRRQALARGSLVDTGEFETGTPHRPARLYRFRDEPGPLSPSRPGPSAPQTKDTP
nr:hypothetical protein [Leucobacter ruminantium]